MQKVWKRVWRKLIPGFDLYREQARGGRDVNDPTPTKPRLQPHSMTILGTLTDTKQDRCKLHLCNIQFYCGVEKVWELTLTTGTLIHRPFVCGWDSIKTYHRSMWDFNTYIAFSFKIVTQLQSYVTYIIIVWWEMVFELILGTGTLSYRPLIGPCGAIIPFSFNVEPLKWLKVTQLHGLAPRALS